MHQLGGTCSNLGSSNDTGASKAHCANSRISPKLLESMRELGRNLVKKLPNQIWTVSQKSSPGSEECKLVMENVEKSRRAIENNVLLRQVILMKENEMKWMEQELSLARERTGHLEMCLQEKHGKRPLGSHDPFRRGRGVSGRILCSIFARQGTNLLKIKSGARSFQEQGMRIYRKAGTLGTHRRTRNDGGRHYV